MKSLFRFSGKYRTDLAPEEVSARIDQLLQSKSKFLLFSFHQYFGAVNGSEFTLTGQRFDWWGIMNSRLKGSMINENGTVVRTRITIPWVLVTFFCLFSLITLSVLLKADQITVNGETRPAEFLDILMMALIVLVIPGCMIYFTTTLPAKRIEWKLIEILQLKRTA
jgi:hypothetical protein